jgi:hypothetical protein
MKYLCLGYCDRKKMDARPKAEIDALMRECQPHVEDLYKSGHLIIDAGLTWETTSVRPVNGKVTVTDGPFVETKEQLGSVFLIEARDLNEAILVASKHPAAQMVEGEQFGWGIEIRPVAVFEKG